MANFGTDATGDAMDAHAARDIEVEEARVKVEEALRQGEAIDVARARVEEALRQGDAMNAARTQVEDAYTQPELEQSAEPDGKGALREVAPATEADVPVSWEPSDEQIVSIPVPMDAVEQRTDDNRINLADDVPDAHLVPTYDGYLDVVMHGDALGTEAAIDDDRVDFTLAETAGLLPAATSGTGDQSECCRAGWVKPISPRIWQTASKCRSMPQMMCSRSPVASRRFCMAVPGGDSSHGDTGHSSQFRRGL